MKKLKLLLLAMLGTMTAVSVSFAVACKHEQGEKPDDTPHEHTYSTEWSNDETHHWHNPTCGDTEAVADKAEHTLNGYNCTECNYVYTPAATDEKVYTALELDTSSVKTEYYIGETITTSDYSSIVGNAVYTHGKATVRESVSARLLRNNMDASEFDNTQVGEYSIKFSWTIGSVTKTADYKVTVSSASVSVEIENDYLECFIGEEFNTSAVAVKLNVIGPDGETNSDVTSDAVIGWDNVDLTKAGNYTVPVSYNVNTLTAVTTSFVVTVLEVREGLDVTLVEGVVAGAEIDEDGLAATITLSSGQKAVLDASKIVVKKSDVYGNVLETPLTSDNYSVEVYNGNVLVEDYTALAGGAYQIWVKADSEIQPGFTLKAFVRIYVVDDLVSLTFNNDEGTLLEQYAGADTISNTWKFTATYTSGVTETIGIADLDNKTVDTATVGENLKFTASYTAANALEKNNTATTEVTYTVKALSGVIDYSVSYTMDFANNAIVTTWGAVQGANSHVALVSNGASTYRQETTAKEHEDGSSYTEAVEVKSGKSLELTIGANLGNVTIKVYATHSSANAVRTVYIAKSGSNVAEQEITGTSDSPLYLLKVENATEGKYTICATDTMRVYAVLVTYQVNYDDKKEEELHNSSLVWSDIAAIVNPDADDLSTDSSALTESAFTDKNGFIKFANGENAIVNFRDGKTHPKADGGTTNSPSCIEIRQDALKVAFTGTGTLVLRVSSTGGNNWSSIAVKDAYGNYIEGTYPEASSANVDTTAAGNNVYAVKGTGTGVTLTFNITVSGTYTICSVDTTLTSASGTNTNRNTRVFELIVNDNY